MKAGRFYKINQQGHDLIMGLLKSNQSSSVSVLLWLSSEMDINSGGISTSVANIATHLDMPERTVYHALTVLTKKGAIAKFGKNVYGINPAITWASKFAARALWYQPHSQRKAANRIKFVLAANDVGE